MQPKTIGRYEVISPLGGGGMATVFLARDPKIKRNVAIKVLHGHFTNQPDFLARFEREAELLARLEHPAIVPIHDFGDQDGLPYLVMRHMPGGSLADRIGEQGALSMTEAVTIVQRLASALDLAHSQGIVHRDLKPGNILFDKSGNAFLADFGIAHQEDATTDLTGHFVVGTPAYMSPEQAQGEEELDGRSDIYALGVIFFEMLTGQKPFLANTPQGVRIKHVVDPVPRIRDIKADLPPDSQRVIEQAMAKDREDRFSTGAELASAVATLVSAASPTKTSSPKTVVLPAPPVIQTPPPAAPAKAKRQYPLGVIISLVVLPIFFIMFCVIALNFLRPVFGLSAEETATPTETAPTEPVATTPPPTATATPTLTRTPTQQPTRTPTRTRTPTAEPTSTLASPTLAAPPLAPTRTPTTTPRPATPTLVPTSTTAVLPTATAGSNPPTSAPPTNTPPPPPPDPTDTPAPPDPTDTPAPADPPTDTPAPP